MASLALHSHSVGMPACSVLWFQACFLLQLRHGALLGQLVTSGMMLRTLRIVATQHLKEHHHVNECVSVWARGSALYRFP